MPGCKDIPICVLVNLASLYFYFLTVYGNYRWGYINIIIIIIIIIIVII